MRRAARAYIPFLILLAAFALRGHAFVANTRAYADVNLMAVAAKEYVLTSTVRYPWALERFDHALDDPLATPAYMHGAAYPFLGGLLAKLLGTRDTFFALKLIDFVGGMALVALTMAFCRRAFSPFAAWVAGMWVATSPVLVDFSGNGSPYILSALSIMALCYLCSRFRSDQLSHYAALGAICALGMQMHAAMLALTGVAVLLGLSASRRLRPAGIAAFVLAWLVCYAPSLVWYMTYFGRPFVSQQVFFVIGELPISGPEREALRENALLLLSSPYRTYYLEVLFSRLPWFFANLIFELGVPMLLFAAASGTALLLTAKRRAAVLVALPAFAYFGVTAVGLALLHMRFLVPVVPTLLVLAAAGLAAITSSRMPLRRVAAAFAVVYAGWAVWSYFTLDTPTARYFRDEAATDQRYDQLDDLARQLTGITPGTLIGCEGMARLAYIIDIRVIMLACPVTPEKIARYVERPALNVRYALAAHDEAAAIFQWFPRGMIVAQNEAYVFISLGGSISPQD